MTHTKLFLLIFISFLSFTVLIALSVKKETGTPVIKKDISGTTALAEIVKNNGWSQESVSRYSYLLQNSKLNIKDERKLLSALTGNIEKAYLQSLLLKRESKFAEMFDSLMSVLEQAPSYFDYYNQVVFSANATGQLHLLESKAESFKLPQLRLLYLNAFINSVKGEYKSACDNFLAIVSLDTNNYEALYQASYMFRNLGEYDKSYSALKEAVLKCGEDNPFKIKALIAEGTLNYLSSEHKHALKLYNKALDISVKQNFTQHIITSLVNIGIIYDNEGNYEKARAHFSEAESLAKEIGDIESEAFVLSEYGVSYSFTGNIIEAKDKYLQCYSLYKKINDRLRLSYLSGNIGNLFVTQFDYSSALQYFENGLEYAGDNKEAKALNLIGMADIYSNLSNYSKALMLYREARELSAQIKSLSFGVQINNSIGSLNFNLNRYSNALNYFKDAAGQSVTEGDNYSAADLLYKTGLTYLMLDSLESANNFLTKALHLSKETDDSHTQALVMANLASLEFKNYNYAAANTWLAKAGGIIKKYELNYIAAECHLIKGDINKAQNNFTAAKENYLLALQLSEKIKEPNLLIEAYCSLAELFVKNNLTEAADAYYKSAIREIDDVSRLLYEEQGVQIAYFSGKNDIYNSYADFLLSRDKYAEAFEVIDRSRSRSTVQKLANLKLENIIKDNKLLSRLYDYEWLIKSGLYDNTAVDSVKILLSVLKKETTRLYPASAVYLERQQAFSLKKVQETLINNETIVSVYSNKYSTYVFLVSSENFTPFRLNIPQKDIRKYLQDISPYYSDVNNGSTFFNQDLFSFNSEASNKLYKVLFKEAFNKLSPGQKLIIVPSTELVTFPVEMLVRNYREEDSPYKYADKDFLLNHYSISYIPSATAYVQQKENNLANNNRSIIVGDPAINTSGTGFADRRGLLEEGAGAGIPRNIALLPLKYSSEEAMEIEDIINADKVFLNSRATETNFKKNALYSSIIHLSTHSFLYNNQPVIFFSNIFDPENDGFLEAGEIAQLNLNSDLVVLSSCNSGLGAVDNAEGILGMTKAFFEAGSKSIVVSLWEVNDKYTSKFMSLFYSKLKEGYDKSEALRLAKTDFIKTYSANPYYWGAFVLSGDISGLQIKSSASGFPYYIVIIILAGISIILLYMRFRKKRFEAIL